MKSAIVLVGGRGTRLGELTTDIPKPMIEVAGRPFLEHVLLQLRAQGIDNICLATGYKADVIEEHFGNNWYDCNLCYSREEEPLGTGGAMRRALLSLDDGNPVVVVNGDTLFKASLSALEKRHHSSRAEVSLVVRHVADVSRYGAVLLDEDGMVRKFGEKQANGPGLVNGGIYMLGRDFFARRQFPERFSFEADVLQPAAGAFSVAAVVDNSYFIDMGIPQDLQRARLELAHS